MPLGQIVFLFLFLTLTSWSQEIPPAAGPYWPLSVTEVAEASSFSASDRFVAAYYFYWYRWQDACVEEVCNPLYTRSHIEFATGVFGPRPTDALTNHPRDLESTDFADPAWHRKQIQDALEGGIDVLLPVFWGVPGRYDEQGHFDAGWSQVGLEALAKALLERSSEGLPNPRIGMFYDTSTLAYESPFHYTQGARDLDLTSELGKKHFYATLRDFFSLVPPKFWARREGRPLVWLYAAEYSGAKDDTLFPDARARFAADFGGAEPWFVAHLDWEGTNPDWVYRWGGAIRPSYLSINSVGPGFDRSGAEGLPRGSKVLRNRDGGRFYREAWERALRSIAPVTVIETWNELHEGTDLCATLEYGRQYIDLTREYADRFKQGIAPPIAGPFQGASEVSWRGSQTLPGGLAPVAVEDGGYRLVQSGTDVLIETGDRYLYFEVEDSFTFSLVTDGTVTVEIEAFDLPETFGALLVEYDSWDRSANYHGIYKGTRPESLSGSFQYRVFRFDLPSARLANNQNEGADFRLVAPKGLRLRSVRLLK